jgi:hypothetical protein
MGFELGLEGLGVPSGVYFSRGCKRIDRRGARGSRRWRRRWDERICIYVWELLEAGHGCDK